jgi:hypothetical protein
MFISTSPQAIYFSSIASFSFNFGQNIGTDEINDGSFVRVALFTRFANTWSKKNVDAYSRGSLAM